MELEIRDLTKEFQKIKAVDHINLTMGEGVYGLLGVNGAGKTTLMRMICTLIRPSQGKITYNGRDIFEMEGDYRKLLGYLPQEFGFYPEFTVQDYLMYAASIKGVRPAVAKKRISVLLRRAGLEDVKNRKMKKLSGGMKRRAGIVQAMLNDPKLLILDEPTAGLDPGERIRFRNLISELSSDRLVLLSTHIVSDIEYIASKVLLMKEGRICRFGTQEEILRSVPVRVWNVRVRKEEVKDWQAQYQISNMKILPQGAELRVLSKEPPCGNAREEEAALEDVFLYWFGERSGEKDDIL